MSQFFRQAQDPVSCATHAWGAVAAFFGGMVLLLRALWAGANMAALAAAMVFAFSLMALYSASAIYHYCPGTVLSGGIKRRLRKLDHSMIYVLIAGSYTPFAMVLMPQPKGARFCLVLWCVAIAGVLGKLFWINAPRAFSTTSSVSARNRIWYCFPVCSDARVYMVWITWYSVAGRKFREIFTPVAARAPVWIPNSAHSCAVTASGVWLRTLR